MWSARGTAKVACRAPSGAQFFAYARAAKGGSLRLQIAKFIFI